MGKVEDVRLLDRARRGDADAFSQLFARYQRGIFRYAAYMCGRESADDVVQETFLAVLRQTDRRDDPRGTLGGYLFGIARHVVMKRLAAGKEEITDDGLDGAPAPLPPTALDQLTRAETIEAVRTAVYSLPSAYRETVVLCDLQEMDYAGAADLMQCPVGTVRSRLHRARTLLMGKLAAMQPAASTGEE